MSKANRQRLLRLLLLGAVGTFVILAPWHSAYPAAEMTPQVIRFNGGRYDNAGASAVDAEGNLYLTGYVETGTSQSSFAVVKYSPQGNLLWRSNYSGTNYGKGLAIAVDRQGNVYATGFTSDGVIFNSNFDYLTVKFSANGVEQWARTYEGPARGFDQATEIAVDASGVYISGFSYGQGYDWATLKYAPDGALLWERRYTGPGNWEDRVGDMALDGDGNLIVTGFSRITGDGETNDLTTLKYDPQGNVLWEKLFSETAISHEFANDLDVDANDNLYITGTTAENFSPYVDAFPLILKYDRNGGLLRMIRDEFAGGISIDADNAGNFYVAGFFPTAPNFSFFAAKYDVSGSRVWATRLNLPESTALSEIKIIADSVGNAFVAGTLRELFTYVHDYLTIKYAPDGAQLWQHRFNGTGNGDDTVAALCGDGADNVYVTGTSWGDYVSNRGTADDIVTLKFAGGSAPPPTGLTPPTNLRATAVSSTGISLRWADNSSAEDGFRIERCQGAGCANFIQIAQVGTGTISYTDTGLTRHTAYTYRVRAFNAAGNSAYSNTASARTRNR